MNTLGVEVCLKMFYRFMLCLLQVISSFVRIHSFEDENLWSLAYAATVEHLPNVVHSPLVSELQTRDSLKELVRGMPAVSSEMQKIDIDSLDLKPQCCPSDSELKHSVRF